MTCFEAAKPGASTEVTWSQPGDGDSHSPRSGRGAWRFRAKDKTISTCSVKTPFPPGQQREERRQH